MAGKSNTRSGALIDSKGNRVPSISTILRKFQDPGALLNWAWRVGKEGKTLDEARESQATAGHVAAARAMALLAGEPFAPADFDPQLVIATDRPLVLFRGWAGDHRVSLERRDDLYVSDADGYGGLVTTAMFEGRTAIFSLKAGKGVYLEDVLTVAAQAHLAGLDTAVLIRFGKDSGGFDECRTLGPAEIAAAWALFRTLLTAYGQVKPVEQIALKGAA